jgi:hypothetical protein
MAKIKSTLDLVMERTKNITVTDEEKEALRRKEWMDKTKAWVRKVMDRKMTMQELRSSFESGVAAYPGLKGILKEELVSHIDPDEDNAAILGAFQEVLGIDIKAFRESISAYDERFNMNFSEHLERLKSELQLRGISGTAVIPNLDNDKNWKASVNRLKAELKNQLKTL